MTGKAEIRDPRKSKAKRISNNSNINFNQGRGTSYKNGLSAETFKAVKTILSKKINGMSVPAEAAADIARVFDLMKADRERNES